MTFLDKWLLFENVDKETVFVLTILQTATPICFYLYTDVWKTICLLSTFQSFVKDT